MCQWIIDLVFCLNLHNTQTDKTHKQLNDTHTHKTLHQTCCSEMSLAKPKFVI